MYHLGKYTRSFNGCTLKMIKQKKKNKALTQFTNAEIPISVKLVIFGGFYDRNNNYFCLNLSFKLRIQFFFLAKFEVLDNLKYHYTSKWGNLCLNPVEFMPSSFFD